MVFYKYPQIAAVCSILVFIYGNYWVIHLYYYISRPSISDRNRHILNMLTTNRGHLSFADNASSIGRTYACGDIVLRHQYTNWHVGREEVDLLACRTVTVPYSCLSIQCAQVDRRTALWYDVELHCDMVCHNYVWKYQVSVSSVITGSRSSCGELSNWCQYRCVGEPDVQEFIWSGTIPVKHC